MTRLSSPPDLTMKRLLCILGAFALGTAWAAAQTAPATTTDPSALASTVSTRSPLQTAGQQQVQNFFDLNLNSQTGYINNVSGSAATAGNGSMFETLGAGVDIQQRRGGLNWALSYEPSYIYYRTFSGYDQFDQAGSVQISDQLSPHWYLRLADTASYGRYLVNPAALSGLPGGRLNLGIATPLARQLSQEPSVELIYVMDYRNSLQFSGDYLERRFSGTGTQNLSNLQGAGGSASYNYRLSRRATIGARYAYENASFGRGVGHMVVQSAFLTYEHVLGPFTTVSLSAGPQRVHQTENLGLLFGGSLLPPIPNVAVRPMQTYWAAQGTISHQAHNTALTLGAQHTISDTGGLLASAAVVSSVTAGIGQQFLERWHADATATYERMSAANLTNMNGAFQGVIAGGGLERAVGQAWRFTARFSAAHQRNQSNAPFAGAFNSLSVSGGVFYSWQLGRR